MFALSLKSTSSYTSTHAEGGREQARHTSIVSHVFPASVWKKATVQRRSLVPCPRVDVVDLAEKPRDSTKQCASRQRHSFSEYHREAKGFWDGQVKAKVTQKYTF